MKSLVFETRSCLIKAAAFSIMLLGASHLRGQSLLVSSPGTGVTTSYTAPYNLGYQFTVGSSPLSVSALGFYDAGTAGLTDSHQVGVWTLSGQLLASVTVPSGLSPTTNGFVFQTVASPITLSANTGYILGAYWPTTADQVIADFVSGTSPTFSGATLVGSRLTPILGTSGFEFPASSNGADGFSWVGANLEYSAVPEPSTYAAITGLSVLGFAALRRRRAPS